jgi:GNAT superfamily N-acetyltransferase
MGMKLISEIEGRHLEDLIALYQEGWWSRNRTGADVRRMLSHTDLVFGMVDSDGDQLVGFARVLTDHVYFALVLDVVVAANYRGQGLGTGLLAAIKAHPTISRVEYLELCCPDDLKPFYEAQGFRAANGRMQIKKEKIS